MINYKYHCLYKIDISKTICVKKCNLKDIQKSYVYKKEFGI